MKMVWKCKECWDEHSIDCNQSIELRLMRVWRKFICPKCGKLTWHLRFTTKSDIFLAKEIGVNKHFEGEPDK